jgi:prolyl-tRNA synthetase
MRMSQLLVQTLREAPTEAGLPGYQFLLRAGFIRSLAPGSYSFLPLGADTRRKIKAIVHQAMRAIGGQEVTLPLVQPADLSHRDAGLSHRDASHRDGLPGDDTSSRRGTVRFRDRAQRDVVLGTSHEEAILTIARYVIQSYRQLPMMLYQVWQPFRDEDRTWGGLFGARETLLVDGYSLHADGTDLEGFYPRAQEAFAGVFEQCRLSVLNVVANGDELQEDALAHKLVWPSEVGDETVIRCDACGYTADQAIARADKTPPPTEDMLPMEDVETPDCKTIADLAQFLNIPESRTAKALFLVAYVEGEGDRFVFVVVRGDTDLNEAKLKRILNAETVGPATEAEIRNLGAEPGYGSPVGLEGVTVVVDDLIPQSPNLVAGANRPGYHTLNVNYGRDYQASIVADITLAQDGDPCPECGAPLRLERGIEVASMAKVGDGYSRALDVTYLDQAGQAQPLVMGRYRLHADRLLAAIAEVHHDEHGIIWPTAIAPYAVYLMTLGKRSEAVDAAAERLYADLAAAGVDVLYDDRDERAGVKFNDADLLGMPLRVVVGERGLKNGAIELKQRHEREIETIPLEDLASRGKAILCGFSPAPSPP